MKHKTCEKKSKPYKIHVILHGRKNCTTIAHSVFCTAEYITVDKSLWLATNWKFLVVQMAKNLPAMQETWL